MKEKFLFKIRDKNTGLFSTGGMYPSWTTKGKTWNGMGPLKSHLNQFMKSKNYSKERFNQIPDNWEVVKIKFIEENVEILKAKDLYPLVIK